MADNWIELMELAKRKNEMVLGDVKVLRSTQKGRGGEQRHNLLSNFVLGGLGKAFSHFGNSLQQHYHFDDISFRKPLKKVL